MEVGEGVDLSFKGVVCAAVMLLDWIYYCTLNFRNKTKSFFSVFPEVCPNLCGSFNGIEKDKGNGMKTRPVCITGHVTFKSTNRCWSVWDML